MGGNVEVAAASILEAREARVLGEDLVRPGIDEGIAKAHAAADLGELLRRYRPAAPEAAILTKLDESTRPGAAMSVLVQHNLPMAYTTSGQRVPEDIELADAGGLASALEFPRRDSGAAIHHDEGRHASA